MRRGMIRMEPLTVPQQEAIRQVACQVGLHEYALVSIGLCHAMRASEFCQLRRDAIDLQDNTILVKRLKNSKTTLEQLMPSEIPVIRELLAVTTGDLLFPFSRTTVYRMVRKCAELAGLPKSCRGPHALKHSVLQTLYDAGLSLPQLMVAGGHRHANSSLRYIEVKQSVVDNLKLKVFGQVGQVNQVA